MHACGDGSENGNYDRVALSGTDDADAVRQLLRLLRSDETADSTELCWNWRDASLKITQTIRNRGGFYNGYPVLPCYFGSFCMDGLSMALWSVYHTASFGGAVEACVNLLGDADSTAAVAGQIAGAIYGYSAMDRCLVESVERWDQGEIAFRGALLHYLAVTRQPASCD